MQNDSILKADILDIIFSSRNKQYGAYTLRKFYQVRLFKSLAITFLLASILLLLSQVKQKEVIEYAFPITIPESAFTNVELPAEKPKPPMQPEKPKQPSIQPPVKTQLYVSTLQFVDQNATKLAVNLDSVDISNVTNTDTAAGKKIVNNIAGPEKKPGNISTPIKTIDKSVPVLHAEEPPVFPGGEAALIRFLQKNLNNPTDLDNGQIVSVKIQFVVGYNGELKGFEVVEDGGKAFNNEVIRVLKRMPTWIPGKTAGSAVSVYYTIPVKFVAPD